MATMDTTNSKKKYYYTQKRLLDITLAGVGLLVLLLFFCLIGLCIKLSDPSAPVLFKQVRVGKKQKPFVMYKFRTMVPNAEEKLAEIEHLNEIEGAMFKVRRDPRVTQLGRILRKASIDELPQLLNVLKGDMSLVGPRPPLPREVAAYTPFDLKRLEVMPGCTGLWQISGRNDLNFSQMVELDLKYIQEQCVLLDLKIMLKTITVMLSPNSAY